MAQSGARVPWNRNLTPLLRNHELERNDAFFRSWYVLIPLISIQIYNSNLFNLNPADYEAYMPHYMTADQAIGYLYVFALSVVVMTTCRLIYRWEQRGDGATS